MRTRSVPHRDMIPDLFDDGIPTSRCDVVAKAVGLLSIRKTGKAIGALGIFYARALGEERRRKRFIRIP